MKTIKNTLAILLFSTTVLGFSTNAHAGSNSCEIVVKYVCEQK